MRRWAVLLAALLALGAAVPAVDAKPKLTKKQQRCLKAAKQKRTKAKRRAAKRRCLRRHSTPTAAPQAAAPAPAAPSAPAAPVPVTPEDPGPALPGDPVSGGRSVQVQSGEYYLRLSRASVLAGDVRVEFDNTRGEDPHDLKLLRGSTLYSFDEQPSGALTAKTLHLGAGTWQLFCALPEHAERGMTATLGVTSG